MHEFTIRGEENFIKITFQEVFGFPETTCYWGGYDLNATLEIKSGSLCAKSSLYTTTGLMYELYQNLKNCNNKLSGQVNYKSSYEGNLEFTIEYDNLGHVKIKGFFSVPSGYDNKLIFGFISDQTFINSTIQELEKIVNEYGNMKGVKGR